MEWISVKDRLPENGRNVLICIENVEIYGRHNELKNIQRLILCGYHYDGVWLTAHCHGCEYIEKMNEKFPDEHITVTHWMPLPDPPKEVSKS